MVTASTKLRSCSSLSLKAGHRHKPGPAGADHRGRYALQDTLAHVPDAVAAVLELYEDLSKPVPAHLRQPVDAPAISLESPIAVA
jgi:hypothetical protein